MAVIWQPHGPLEWLHLALHQLHVINLTSDLIAMLVCKGRTRTIQLFGKEPNYIILPMLTKNQYEHLLQHHLAWQTAFASYPGQINFHLPSDKLLHFLAKTAICAQRIIVPQPLPSALTVFVDADKRGNIAIHAVSPQHKNTQRLHYNTSSVQRAELKAIALALERYTQPLNLFTDSQYAARTVPQLPEAYILSNDEELFHLFKSIQLLLLQRQHPLFITHIRAHSNLPGPLAEGNHIADENTHIFFTNTIQAAKSSHAKFHQNAQALRRQYGISREESRQIVRECQSCPQFFNPPSYAINPRGLLPNHLWQMDVTTYLPFGRLKYIHVSIDTFSNYIFATAHSGEAFVDVQNHLFAAFAVLGMPKALKTDNGSAYTSSAFQTFCANFHITHTTG
uniref:RNA-directed DNA polymerase n=1 Tax=Callorhinus ursinus TaxID=34884 RepID=A0A3Q7Q0M2_CALUR|nr:uncharacterized protein LOC112819052 [Callorhinus ursinus]